MALVLGPYILTLFLGRRILSLLGYTQRDLELLYPFKEKVFYSLMRESGYMHIQCTKPDTVGEHALRTLQPPPGRCPHPSMHPARRQPGALTCLSNAAHRVKTSREGPNSVSRGISGHRSASAWPEHSRCLCELIQWAPCPGPLTPAP